MLVFRKSSYCEALNQDGCVEVADGGALVVVRDSTDPQGPRLSFGRSAFRVLVLSARHDVV